MLSLSCGEGFVFTGGIIMNEERLFHLDIPTSVRVGYAILPGDPGRVDKIAKHLSSPRLAGSNREFRSVIGTLDGESVIVTSTGIGGPSAAIALEELGQIGVGCAVRIGTCGGIQLSVAPGDLVIPTAAVRMEGTSKEYAPAEYPAAADFTVLSELAAAAGELGYRFHAGVIQSKDSFYGQHSPQTMPVHYELENKWDAWKRLGVLASEMETAALFTVGAVRGIKLGCVLHALWNQERKEKGLAEQADFDTGAAIKTAVLALRKIIGKKDE